MRQNQNEMAKQKLSTSQEWTFNSIVGNAHSWHWCFGADDADK